MYRVKTHVLWYNDGTADQTIVDEQTRAIVPATGFQDVSANGYTPGSGFRLNASSTNTGDWWKINLTGADYMQIMWHAVLVDRNTIDGAATLVSDEMSFALMGSPYVSDTDSEIGVPYPVTTAGISYSGLFGQYEFASWAMRVTQIAEDAASDNWVGGTCFGAARNLRGTFFAAHARANFQPVNGDKTGGWFWAGWHNKRAAETTALEYDVQRVSGLSTVWLAANHFPNWDSTGDPPGTTTIKAKGLLVVNLYKEAGSQGRP